MGTAAIGGRRVKENAGFEMSDDKKCIKKLLAIILNLLTNVYICVSKAYQITVGSNTKLKWTSA